MKGLNYHLHRFVKKNGSTILTVLGVVGTVSTAVATAKATPKAIKLINDKKAEKGSNLTVLETIETSLPAYTPSLLIGTATIGCILGINALNKRQQASMMSAYMLVENSYNTYKKKVKELYGEEAHQKIIDSIVQEKVKDVDLAAFGCFDVMRLEEDDDDTPRLFYDLNSERYFESTLSKVISAEYHFNRNFAIRGSGTLNELYSLLGLTHIPNGYDIGWTCNDMLENAGIAPWVDFNHRKVEMEDGLICYIIETPYEPTMEAIEEW